MNYLIWHSLATLHFSSYTTISLSLSLHKRTLYLEWAPIAMATLAYWLIGRLYPTAEVGLLFICVNLLREQKTEQNISSLAVPAQKNTVTSV